MKDDKKVGIRFGEEVAGRTIVGGRGTVRKTGKVSVPVGIEKVLYLAATDAAFRERLRTDREGVVTDRRLKLEEDEAGILRGVPDEQLLLMIQNIDPAKHGRRKFIRSVAACAASLAAGSVLVECGDDEETIIKGATVGAGEVRADVPDHVADAADTETDASHGMDAGGAGPDVPDLPDVSADVETTDAGDTVDIGVDAGQIHGIMPDASEEQDASDGGSPDHVEVDVDAGQSFGILPDSGEPDRVEVDYDGARPAGILPDGGDE
jgi:hypothetical protein